jgi:hypothetical protein
MFRSWKDTKEHITHGIAILVGSRTIRAPAFVLASHSAHLLLFVIGYLNRISCFHVEVPFLLLNGSGG